MELSRVAESWFLYGMQGGTTKVPDLSRRSGTAAAVVRGRLAGLAAIPGSTQTSEFAEIFEDDPANECARVSAEGPRTTYNHRSLALPLHPSTKVDVGPYRLEPRRQSAWGRGYPAERAEWADRTFPRRDG